MKDGVKGLRMNSVKHFHLDLQIANSGQSPMTEAHRHFHLLFSKTPPPRLIQQPREMMREIRKTRDNTQSEERRDDEAATEEVAQVHL